MPKKWTPGEIVIVAAGGLMLIGSFLSWYDLGSTSRSSWGSGFFPLATLVPIIGTLMALQIVLTNTNALNLGVGVGDFSWTQLHLVGGIAAAVLMFCWLVLDRGGADLGVGFFFNLLGALGLLVGALILRTEHRAPPAPAEGTI